LHKSSSRTASTVHCSIVTASVPLPRPFSTWPVRSGPTGSGEGSRAGRGLHVGWCLALSPGSSARGTRRHQSGVGAPLDRAASACLRSVPRPSFARPTSDTSQSEGASLKMCSDRSLAWTLTIHSPAPRTSTRTGWSREEGSIGCRRIGRHGLIRRGADQASRLNREEIYQRHVCSLVAGDRAILTISSRRGLGSARDLDAHQETLC
jgi:hypothetical protein